MKVKVLHFFNPWAFGLIFLSVAGYLLWIDFNIHSPFSNFKGQTKGLVLSYHFIPGMAGRGSNQVIQYAFRVDDSLYFDQEKVPHLYKKRDIGSFLNVFYNAEKPKENRVEDYLTFTPKQSEKQIFTWRNKYDYNELKIVNNIALLEMKTKFGKLTDAYWGQTKKVQDTLYFSPLLQDFEKENALFKFYSTTDSTNSSLLIECNSSQIYFQSSVGSRH